MAIPLRSLVVFEEVCAECKVHNANASITSCELKNIRISQSTSSASFDALRLEDVMNQSDRPRSQVHEFPPADPAEGPFLATNSLPTGIFSPTSPTD